GQRKRRLGCETKRISLPRSTIAAMKVAARMAEDELVDGVADGTGDNPFAVLGRHAATVGGTPAVVIRTMQPAADVVEVVVGGRAIPMARRHPEGVFEAIFPLADVDGAPEA